MGDNQSSFLNRFLDRSTNSSTKNKLTDNSEDINFENVRHHKCEANQKSFVSSLFEKLAKRYADRKNDEVKCTRTRPPAAPKAQTELDGKDGKDDKDDKDKKSQITKRKDEQNKEQNKQNKGHPSAKLETDDSESLPTCFIKEQNPLAPACCEVKSDDDDDEDDGPCPPSGYSQNPRVPGCGCDRCRKSGYHGRCCERRTYAQQSIEAPPRLEKA